MSRKGYYQVMCGAIALIAAGVMMGCGSSSSDSSSSTTTTAAPASLSEVPDTQGFVRTSGASANVAVTKAVSGTAPLLKDISSSNADALFWNGLVATINAAGTATQTQANEFWKGEGACRMAQVTGFSFQDILQSGVSLCYLRNMPNAANGVSIVSGASSASEIFAQGASNKLVQIKVSNMPKMEKDGMEEAGPEDMRAVVYGSGSEEGSPGYAVDLIFCSSGSVLGYQTIRMNKSTGVLATTSVDKHTQGTFVGTMSANITKSGSDFIFDPSKTREANVYFSGMNDAFTFLGNVVVGDGTLTARSYNSGKFGDGPSTVGKHAVYSQYSGDTMEALRFLAASFAVESVALGTTNGVTGAVEYQTSRYGEVTSGSLLDSARSDKFTHAVYAGDTTSYKAKVAAMSNFSCSGTPDVVVAMDMSASAPKAVAAKCESPLKNQNFCDGATITAARGIVMMGQSMRGSCPTTYCVVGEDFTCQKWADNHLGNAQGLTTANAQCSSTGCCTKK